MGIIKAVASSVSSVAGDQWKDYFYCESIPDNIVMVRGMKQAGQGDADVITDGSVIAVADGQCAIVVSAGKVTAVFTDPGETVFRNGASPGIFSGSSLKSVGKEVIRRVGFGGDVPAVVQRVYYLNTKEITGNPFGSEEGVPFRIRDDARNVDIDCTLFVSGLYSFRISEPAKIYKAMIGNVSRTYTVDSLKSVVALEVNNTILQALGAAFYETYRPSMLGEALVLIKERTMELSNEALGEARGIQLVSIGFDSLRLKEGDSGMTRNLQFSSALSGVVQVKFCPECGTKISVGGEKFCRECGYKFISTHS